MWKIDLKQCLLLALALTCGIVPASAQDGVLDLGKNEFASRIPGSGPLTNEQIAEWLSHAEDHKPLAVKLPLGLSLGQAR